MTIIDLKAALGSGGSGNWRIGEVQRRLWKTPATPPVFERDGMTLIDRSQTVNINASEFPDLYAEIGDYYGTSVMPIRTPTYTANDTVASTSAKGNVVISIIRNTSTNATTLQRSTDGGGTWSQVSVTTTPANTRMELVHYNATNDRWYIFYVTNRVLISTDGTGTSFTDTAVTGLDIDFTVTAGRKDLRAVDVDAVVILANENDVWTFPGTGTTWTKRTSSTGNKGGKLTTGNGYAVLMNNTLGIHYTTNGTTWTSGGTLTGQSGSYSHNYGCVYNGQRWIVGLGGKTYGEIDSGVPATSPAPSTSGFSYPSYSVALFAYTAGGVPSGWTYKNYSTAGGPINVWTSQAGHTNWFASYQNYGYYSGAISAVGAVRIVDEQYGFDYDIHNPLFWESMITNLSTGAYPSFFNLEYGSRFDSSSNYNRAGVTSSGRMWIDVSDSGAKQQLSGESEVIIQIPAYSDNVLPDVMFGKLFLRIK